MMTSANHALSLGHKKAMRSLALFILLSVFPGCSTTPDIAVPKVTRFDHNREARRAYLEAYRAGYQKPFGLTGCTFGMGGEVATAREIGWYDGQMAAHKAHELQLGAAKKEQNLK